MSRRRDTPNAAPQPQNAQAVLSAAVSPRSSFDPLRGKDLKEGHNEVTHRENRAIKTLESSNYLASGLDAVANEASGGGSRACRGVSLEAKPFPQQLRPSFSFSKKVSY